MRGTKGIDSAKTFANRTIFRSFGCRFGRSSCPSDSFPAEATSSRTKMKREAGVVCRPADDSQRRKTPNPAGFGLRGRKALGYGRASRCSEPSGASCESLAHECESLPLEFQASDTSDGPPPRVSVAHTRVSVALTRVSVALTRPAAAVTRPADADTSVAVAANRPSGTASTPVFIVFRQAQPSAKP